MPGNHLRMKSREKRLVLIVDDELINREMLGMSVQDEYDVIYASDGMDALNQIRKSEREISLILLDLMMPIMSGMEVLKKLTETPEWAKIPVIVMTSDRESEVICLELGAMDFISKPYPQRDIILARMRRIIELSEDRELIHSTERDPLTGLYNREFFYNYASTFDQHHKNEPMDAIVLDISRFHRIIERYGRAQSNEILNRIAANLREIVQVSGGIVCRREADTFMVYCPHRTDYSQMLAYAARGLEDEPEDAGRIRLRLGVYQNADKSVSMEQRFNRAKAAADSVRGKYNKEIGIYDNRMHEQEKLADQLTEDFERAIQEKQFRVFYQPKYNVRGNRPHLSSAEALVRWEHPDLGMISPGMFIPLFEENGMIGRLDNYVWEETARQIRAWKDEYGTTTAVSVNVSRIDIADPRMVSFFADLLEKYALDPMDLILEVTESAYTDDEDFIIDAVHELRKLGLRVEMDDFGSGYSSLGMISQLPIDALKLDMAFVRNAFSGSGDSRIIELVVDIAAHLQVPVVAEGVESQDQVDALKKMGCDIIQGYHFSRPVPAEEFIQFIEKEIDQKTQTQAAGTEEAVQTKAVSAEEDSLTFARIAQALAQDYFTVYYINMNTGAYREYSLQGEDHRMLAVASGDDFFKDYMEQIPDRIIPEDRDRVRKAFSEKNFLQSVRRGNKFSMNYQALDEGGPMNVSVKAIRLTDDRNHFLIGMSNIDDEVRRERAYQDASEKSVTYVSLAQALAADYFSIYYVDIRTDRFFEFTAHASYEDLGIEKEGEDFFGLSRRNILRVMHPEDQHDFLQVFTKDNVLAKIREDGAFTVTYRLMFDGVPNYVSLKATPMGGRDAGHIVVGVNNIHREMQQQLATVTYASISEALAADYFCIYYVDMETDRFEEYSSHEEYENLGIEKEGQDFFGLSRKNILRVMYPEDQKEFLEVFTKENLIRELDRNGTFTISYRLIFDGRPSWVSMKATRMIDPKDTHIVIGVNNIDLQMKRQEEYERTLHQSLTYSRIAQALSRDYSSIYMVNTETDEFVEYSSNAAYRELQMEQSGDNFFGEARKKMIRLVHPNDLKKALMVWEKDQLLKEVEDGRTLSVTYRLLFDGNEVYINCKVIRMDADEGQYIVIGISNVNEQIRREKEIERHQESAKSAAMKDPLTGVKSKHAFIEAERKIDKAIAEGTQGPFAVAVCDVNGLKEINDTQGHKAGDRFIQDACTLICTQFKHSPVFRIGGDEFVAILQGKDYRERQKLAAQFGEQNEEHLESGNVVIACGIASWEENTAETIEKVFERADEAMYENKKELKS